MDRAISRRSDRGVANLGQSKGATMKKYLAVLTVLVFVVGMFAAPALGQELTENDLPEGTTLDDIPAGMTVEDFIAQYTDVEGIVIERPPEAPPERPTPPVRPAETPADVEVLGVTEERALPVTGSDLLGLVVIGFVLAGLGFLAIRRGRGTATEA